MHPLDELSARALKHLGPGVAPDLHLGIHQLVTSSQNSTQHTIKVPDELSAGALKHLGPGKGPGSSLERPHNPPKAHKRGPTSHNSDTKRHLMDRA